MNFQKDLLPRIVDYAIKEEEIDIDRLCEEIEACDNIGHSRTVSRIEPNHVLMFGAYNQKHWRYEHFTIHYNNNDIITYINTPEYKTPIFEKDKPINKATLRRRLKNC